METIDRLYDAMLEGHLSSHRQMAFVSGPRQVGKTTTCSNRSGVYLNWDNTDDREILLGGPGRLAAHLGLDQLSEQVPVALFDELHKHPRGKQLLKGFFDTYGDQMRVIVTGSSRLDTYRRVGDSLMGRYFLYHMHPFSVAETLTTELPDAQRAVRPPRRPDEEAFAALWNHGGYPEPFLKRDARFSRRWQSLRRQQLLREDVRDLTQIQHLDQLEMLVKLLDVRSGHQIIYSNLARDIQVGVETVKRWCEALGSLNHGFQLKPWFANVSRSLRKEPKWFLRDWAGIDDRGDRAETFIACHLLKAVEGWNDLGLGNFRLAYLRDKEKREVDFIVIRDGDPWFLAEVKHSRESIGESLGHFQRQTKAPFAFQIVIESDYIDADCFATPRGPLAVPARTFLSQLL
ncbi:MAG TPA: AAA family ATPase [Luteolibacter sp.]|nr:AAA family ATPase [Luteolibacter sp.]